MRRKKQRKSRSCGVVPGGQRSGPYGWWGPRSSVVMPEKQRWGPCRAGRDRCVSAVFVPTLLAACLLSFICSACRERRGDALPDAGQVQSMNGTLLDLIELVHRGTPDLEERETACKSALEQSRSVVSEFDFQPGGGTAGWREFKDADRLEVGPDGGLIVHSVGPNAQIVNLGQFESGRVQRILITMRVSGGERCTVFWKRSSDRKYMQNRSRSVLVKPDGRFHTYTLAVGTHRHWNGMINAIRIHPMDASGTAEIRRIEYQAGFGPDEEDLLQARFGLPGSTIELSKDRRPVLPASGDGEPLRLTVTLPAAGPVTAEPSGADDTVADDRTPLLSVAFGVASPGWSGGEPGSPYRFKILVTPEGQAEPEILLDETIDPIQRRNHRLWIDRDIPLDRYAGRRVELAFLEERAAGSAGRPSFGVWAHPVIRMKEDERPNLLLILVDTLRADHLGCYGGGERTSPHIDRLSRQGLLFEDAVSTSSWTAPAVASLFTSRHVYNHGVRYVDTLRLDQRHETLAEQFRLSGFFTGAVSDNLLIVPSNGYDQGFLTFLSKPEHILERKAEAITDAAIHWMGKHGRRPFFCYLHYMDPHSTYQPPEPFHPGPPAEVSRIDPDLAEGRLGALTNRMRQDPGHRAAPAEMRRLLELYDGEIAVTDFHLGRLLAWMQSRGLMDRTVVVFLADHGEEFGDHGKFGHATSLHDELVRVPLIISAPPGLLPGGRKTTRATACMIDIAPTLLTLLGLEGFSATVDGDPLFGSPDSAGDAAAGKPVYCELNSYSHSPEAPGWVESSRGLRAGRLKLLYSPRTGRHRLYDLDVDPGETRDLYDPDTPSSAELARLLAVHLEAGAASVSVESDYGQGLDDEQLRQLKALGYLE